MWLVVFVFGIGLLLRFLFDVVVGDYLVWVVVVGVDCECWVVEIVVEVLVLVFIVWFVDYFSCDVWDVVIIVVIVVYEFDFVVFVGFMRIFGL